MKTTAIKILSSFILCVAITCAPSRAAFAQSNQKLYSLFIYCFAKNMQWPQSDLTDFKIGVISDPALQEELTKGVAGKTVSEKNLQVLGVKELDEVKNFQMIFVPRSKATELARLSKLFPAHPILIISEGTGLIDQGSAIDLFLEEGKLRFEFSLSSIEKRGIKIPRNLRSMGTELK